MNAWILTTWCPNMQAWVYCTNLDISCQIFTRFPEIGRLWYNPMAGAFMSLRHSSDLWMCWAVMVLIEVCYGKNSCLLFSGCNELFDPCDSLNSGSWCQSAMFNAFAFYVILNNMNYNMYYYYFSEADKIHCSGNRELKWFNKVWWEMNLVEFQKCMVFGIEVYGNKDKKCRKNRSEYIISICKLGKNFWCMW